MNKTPNSNALALLTATAGAAIMALSLWPNTAPTKTGSAGAPGSPTTETKPAEPLGWSTHRMLAPTTMAENYSVEFLGTMTPFAHPGGATPDPAFGDGRTAVAGQLEVAALPLLRGDGWLAMRLTGHTVELNTAASRLIGQASAVQRALARPWTARIDAAGHITDLRIPAGTPVGAQGVVATISYGLQFVPATKAATAAWTTEEVDVNGRYNATYSRADGSVQKRWSLDSQDGEANTAAAMGYSHVTHATYRFGARTITDLRWEQKGAVALSLGGTSAKPAPFSNAVSLIHSANADATWAMNVDPSALVPIGTAANDRRAQVVAPRDVNPTIAAASQLDATKDMHRRAALRETLSASIRADSTVAATLAQRLVAGADNEVANRTIIEALAAAGTREAERAIVDMVDDDTATPWLKGRLLVAATLMTHPSAEYVAAMTGVMLAASGDFKSTIGVALGGSANALGASNPAVASELVNTLVTHANPAVTGIPNTPAADPPSMRERMQWVAALGNTASPEAFDSIVSALDDPKQPVRQAAAFALRFQDPAKTLPRLVDYYAIERDASVREALLVAARYIGATALPVVKKALLTDRFESVRLEAAYTVAAWGMEAPGMRSLLVEALKHERSDTVRETLRNYIEPGRIAAPFAVRPAVGGAQ